MGRTSTDGAGHRWLGVPRTGAVVRAEAAGWVVERCSGDAGSLHALDVPPARTVRVHGVDTAAVVLGSTQAAGALAEALPPGVVPARRRSGGGAVWLAPGAQVWVDVVIPSGDVLWDDDVGRAAGWLGQCWARVVGEGASVWEGPMEGRATGSVACFAGLGPGEVVHGGRKVVGISQRRTARHARFQCVAYLGWDPAPLLEALGPVDPAVSHRLVTAGGGLPAEVARGGEWGVVERLLGVLPPV